VAVMLPVAINGFGVRESALLVFALALGQDMGAGQAVALGLAASMVTLIVSLIGGVIYLLPGKDHEPAG
jgi:hypothetical protein